MGFNENFLQGAPACTSSDLNYPVTGAALYEMENNGNSTSSSSFDATSTTNVTFSSSVKKFGTYSASFNNTSSIMRIPANSFHYTALTVSVWVYPSGSGYRTIINTYDYGIVAASKGWFLRIADSTNKAHFGNYNGDCGVPYPTDPSCTNVTVVYSNSAISTSGWTHIAVTMDNSYMKMYINGTAQTGNTAMASNGIGYASGAGVEIGALDYTAGVPEGFYSGYMDELRVYNSVLSASNVALLAGETC